MVEDYPTATRRLPFSTWEIVVSLAIVLLIGIAIAVAYTSRRVDHRLIGTWQSDVDRTLIALHGPPPYDPKREAAARKLYGRMRLTYTPTTCTSDLDGFIQSEPYEVLGSDKVSVVIRILETKPSPLDDIIELSSFHIIRFEGSNYIQVHSEIGGTDEVFRRIK